MQFFQSRVLDEGFAMLAGVLEWRRGGMGKDVLFSC